VALYIQRTLGSNLWRLLYRCFLGSSANSKFIFDDFYCFNSHPISFINEASGLWSHSLCKVCYILSNLLCSLCTLKAVAALEIAWPYREKLHFIMKLGRAFNFLPSNICQSFPLSRKHFLRSPCESCYLWWQIQLLWGQIILILQLNHAAWLALCRKPIVFFEVWLES
jgi:hypothetical protein